jgi:hypothetical protein
MRWRSDWRRLDSLRIHVKLAVNGSSLSFDSHAKRVFGIACATTYGRTSLKLIELSITVALGSSIS